MPKEFIQQTTRIPQFLPAYGLLLADDFSNGMQVDASGDGTDFRAELSRERWLTPPAALLVKTRTTGAAANDGILIQRNIPLFGLSLLSFYVTISIVNRSFLKRIKLDIWITKAGWEYYGRIWLNPTANNITYWYNNSMAANVPGSYWGMSADHWQIIEFTIDPQNLTYYRISCGDRSYDMSDIALNDYDNTLQHENSVRLEVEAAGANPPEVYIDSMAVIQHG